MSRKKVKNVARRSENPMYRIHALYSNVYIRDLDLKIYKGDLTGIPISAKEIAMSEDLRKALTGDIKIDGTKNDIKDVKVALERDFKDKLDPSIPNEVDDSGTLICFEQDPLFFNIDDARRDISPNNDGSSMINDLLPIFVIENKDELKQLIKAHKTIKISNKKGTVTEEEMLIPAAYDGMIVYVKNRGDNQSEIVRFEADYEIITIENNYDKRLNKKRNVKISDRTGRGSFVFSDGSRVSGKKEGFGPSLSINLDTITDLNDVPVDIKNTSRKIKGIKFVVGGEELVGFSLADNANVTAKLNGAAIPNVIISGSINSENNGMLVTITLPDSIPELNALDRLNISLDSGFVKAFPDENKDGIADSDEEIACNGLSLTMTIADAILPEAELTMDPSKAKFGADYTGNYSINLVGGDYPNDLTIKAVTCDNLELTPNTDLLSGIAKGKVPVNNDLKASFEILFNETFKTKKISTVIKAEDIHLPQISVKLTPEKSTFGEAYNGIYNIDIIDNIDNLTIKSIEVNKGTIDGGTSLTGRLNGFNMPNKGNILIDFIFSFNETSKTIKTSITIEGINHQSGIISNIDANLGTANLDGLYEEIIDCTVSANIDPKDCLSVNSAKILLNDIDITNNFNNNLITGDLYINKIVYPSEDVNHIIRAEVIFEDGHIATKELKFTQHAPQPKMYVGFVEDWGGTDFGLGADGSLVNAYDLNNMIDQDFIVSKADTKTYPNFASREIGNINGESFEQDGLFITAVPISANKKVIWKNSRGEILSPLKKTIKIYDVDYEVYSGSNGSQTTLVFITD